MGSDATAASHFERDHQRRRAMSQISGGSKELLISTRWCVVALRDSGPELSESPSPGAPSRLSYGLRIGFNLPFDRRGTWRAMMGGAERTPRRGLLRDPVRVSQYWHRVGTRTATIDRATEAVAAPTCCHGPERIDADRARRSLRYFKFQKVRGLARCVTSDNHALRRGSRPGSPPAAATASLPR
jgi:hypothetical protein